MHKLLVISMAAITANAVNMQAKSQVQSQALSVAEMNALSEAQVDFDIGALTNIAGGMADKAKKMAAQKARQLKKQAMRKARRAKRMAVQKAKQMEKQALKEVAAINPQAAVMLQDQLDNAEANLAGMAENAQAQMGDKLAELEERAAELDPNVISDKFAETLEENLGVDVNAVMDKVEEAKDLAEDNLGTLDPEELKAMLQEKVDETGIVDKLKDPSSITMTDLLEAQQQAQSIDVDDLKEQALEKKDDIQSAVQEAVDELELQESLQAIQDTAQNASLEDLIAVKDDMVEATGTEDLVADLVTQAQEKAEMAEKLYNQNDGDAYLELLKDKANEVNVDSAKEQLAELTEGLNLDENSAVLQQVASQVMNNGADVVSSASDVAQRIMDGEDPTQVALEVALENKDTLQDAAGNETLQSVVDQLVSEDQKEQLKNDAMEAILANPEALMDLVTEA